MKTRIISPQSRITPFWDSRSHLSTKRKDRESAQLWSLSLAAELAVWSPPSRTRDGALGEPALLLLGSHAGGFDTSHCFASIGRRY